MTKVLTKSGKVIKVVSHEEEKESMRIQISLSVCPGWKELQAYGSCTIPI